MSAVRCDRHVLEVPITTGQLERALAREEDMTARVIERFGRNYLNDSIKEGQGVFTGLLGEEVIYDFYEQQWVRSTGDDIYNWDLRNQILGRVDVKTKLQNYDKPPRSFYNCTVCDANIRQLCDWYCFVRIHKDCERAWILGFLPKEKFFNVATFAAKGEVDSSSWDDWTFKWNCWNAPISKLLIPPDDVAGFANLVRGGQYADS
ncbi:hypothetical protein EBZ80_17495 [bacterium]|nr:hypothetical protein [Betaproteobacteria bacterium]NDE16722.1 hypothetical protein [bacterium]